VSSWMKEHWSNSRKVPNHIPTQVESITCLWNISILLLESYHVVSWVLGLFLFVFCFGTFNSRTLHSCCYLSVLGLFWVFLVVITLCLCHFDVWILISFVKVMFLQKMLSILCGPFVDNFCFLILCSVQFYVFVSWSFGAFSL